MTLPAVLEDPALGRFAELSLLALIQGLTEFLPISSSGHLVLAEQAMHLATPMAIDVALHLGTLFSVVVIYRGSLARFFVPGERGDLWLVALATVPAAVVGLAFGELVEAARNPRAVALGLLVTGVVLSAGERARRRVRARGAARAPLDVRRAILIGLAQACAILPGVSRSGCTIAAGLLLGLAPERAARFSFLMSIPAVLGAAVLELPALAGSSDVVGAPGHLVWAVLFAGFIGWGALRALLAFLDRGAFLWFALYCAVLGGGTLLFA